MGILIFLLILFVLAAFIIASCILYIVFGGDGK